MPWPVRASVCDSRTTERLFVPAHVPVPVELASLLGEVRDPLEAEPLMECDRRLVGQIDVGVGTVHDLALQLLEDLLIEPGPDDADNLVGRDVDQFLYRVIQHVFSSISPRFT